MAQHARGSIGKITAPRRNSIRSVLPGQRDRAWQRCSWFVLSRECCVSTGLRAMSASRDTPVSTGHAVAGRKSMW
eukprot:3503430-Rhodomonas_salina.2